MNRAVVGAGVLAFGLGVAAMVAPGLIPLRLDRTILPFVGLVPFVLVYRVVQARRRSGVRRSATPDPEVPVSTPFSGDDLATAASDLTGSRSQFLTRPGLRQAAATVLERYEGLTATEAGERLSSGTWTDDPYARAFFLEEGRGLSLADRLRARLRSGSSYRVSLKRVVAALADRVGVAPEYGGDGSRLIRRTGGDDGVVEVDLGDEPRRERTGHWRAVSAVALLAIGIGVVFETAPVVLSGVVGAAYAAYGRSTAFPSVELAVDRELSTTTPEHEEAVEVTVTVRNDGDDLLPDVRVVDGVPEALSVVEGSPRLGTALRGGESATFTYDVEARRGVHDFEPVLVLVRNLAGSTEEARRIDVPTALTCVPRLVETPAPVPLRESATQYAGRVETSSGGEGVEFYATREYRPGDPPSRIDWNRRARGDQFATLEFREERAATVMVVVDARPVSFVSHGYHVAHAVDRSVEAAGRVVAARLAAGDRVGLATFGADPWLDPGTGREHRARLRELLATHPSLSSVPPDGPAPARWRRRLRQRLPVEAQLVVLSPLADAHVSRYVRRLDAAGNPVSVISPDPTITDTPGRLLAAVARRVRISELRGAGVPVADWSPDESLESVLASVDGRWSR